MARARPALLLLLAAAGALALGGGLYAFARHYLSAAWVNTLPAEPVGEAEAAAIEATAEPAWPPGPGERARQFLSPDGRLYFEVRVDPRRELDVLTVYRVGTGQKVGSFGAGELVVLGWSRDGSAIYVRAVDPGGPRRPPVVGPLQRLRIGGPKAPLRRARAYPPSMARSRAP